MTALDGKIALVTGASRGLGAAIAHALAANGALVLVHYAVDHQAAVGVVLDIQHRGGRAAAIRADLAAPDGPRQLWAAADEALRHFELDNSVDILVNNAGINERGSIDQATPANFDRLVALNQRAPVFVTQLGLKRMRDFGRIINISSGTARYARPDVLIYSMTKGALEVFTRTLAGEVGSRGITVNAVAPSALDTDMNASWLRGNTDARAVATAKTALGSMATPADVALVVRFLASPDAQWVTGQTVDATGGNSL